MRTEYSFMPKTSLEQEYVDELLKNWNKDKAKRVKKAEREKFLRECGIDPKKFLSKGE